jgi:hypothetical protein
MVFRDTSPARMAEQLRGWPDGAMGVLVDGADAAGTVAAAVGRVAAMGMTTVLVHSTDDDPDPVGFVEWLGAEVLPRVTA